MEINLYLRKQTHFVIQMQPFRFQAIIFFMPILYLLLASCLLFPIVIAFYLIPLLVFIQRLYVCSFFMQWGKGFVFLCYPYIICLYYLSVVVYIALLIILSYLALFWVVWFYCVFIFLFCLVVLGCVGIVGWVVLFFFGGGYIGSC